MPTGRPADLTHPTPATTHPTGFDEGEITKPALRTRIAPLLGIAALTALTAIALTAVALAAPAHAAAPVAPVTPTLGSVIDALRLWLVGILAALATLFLTVGGIRYLTAAGDPAQVERAKVALKSAAIGYALAALAPLLVTILQSVVAT